MARIRTKHYPGLVDKDVASEIYQYLLKNIPWRESVKSKGRHTRNGCALAFPEKDSEDLVSQLVTTVMENKKLDLPENVQHLGVYLNHYKDGNEFSPSHNHPKQVQVIISLGATRTLIVGKKEYKLKSGDVIVFGSSMHSVPKDPDVKEGRISIATFSLCLDKLT